MNSITNNVKGSRQNTYSPKTISQTPPIVNPNSNNSTLSRVKDQTDTMKYGRNVQDDVDRMTKALEDALTKVDKSKIGSGDENRIKYPHLYNEETVSQEFINDVNPEIENAIINLRNGKPADVPGKIKVTELSDRAIAELSSFVGIDVSDYSVKIEIDALRHIDNRHGINGKHDKTLSDPKDIARIGYVINNFDNIEWAKDSDGNAIYSKQYRDKNGNRCPVIILTKKIDGTFCVGDVVPETDSKTIWVTSARIEKRQQAPNDTSVSLEPNVRNGVVASADIIFESGENVNPNSNNSSLNRVKDQSDVMKYGRNVQDDVDRMTKALEDALTKVDKSKIGGENC